MSTAIPERLRSVEGAETCAVHVLWDPVWTLDRPAPSARAKPVMPLEELEPYRERRLADRERTRE
ncbi:MAG TPA: hypothetical protein VN213_06895 [Solirubrobacteraceae bacterium]|nr:hypothetical protein [Solirubrobacteraceae bacterium]